ncbi:MAG TPA: HD-GYP domain-containing protein, partial [Ilumatobacteraceae bacterium]|nr:HD-GYP domain-containing protein [Ilumatobacteraceae bacterium]
EAAEKLLELVAALSLHDRLTRGHSERVRAYTHMVGSELNISGAALDHLRWSALLHDIGKLLVSAEILNKPGKLTDTEFDVVKQHPEFGRELVAPLVGWLGDAARAVWEHHERWDGRGYPRGLSGSEISLAGRIVAVTDAFDVMTSARSYKEPISPAAARAELARCAGSQFDETIVRAFLNVSLGRLRMAMGPLSWLTQLSFVPQALATAGASGATAVTAVVGLAAGALGAGLNDANPFSSDSSELSASPTDPIDDVAPSRITTTSGAGGDGGGSTTEIATPNATFVATVRSSTTTIPSTVSVTTVVPAPSTATTEPRTVPTSTSPAATPGDTTADVAPPGTAAPDPEPPAAPPATPPATDPPPTAPTTAAPPTPIQDGTVIYLSSPGSGDVESRTVLPLSVDQPPVLASVPNYDTDRDNDAGLLLKHDSGPESEQLFRLELMQAVHLRGVIPVELFASARNNNGSFTLDVRLRSCRGTDCTEVAYERVTATSTGIGFVSMAFDLVPIDTVLSAGDALELVISVPTSGHHVWLAYDTSATASRFTVGPS